MGEVFAGRYELVDPIGRGGVGAVWRAWDQRRRRYVAAKVLQQSDAHALLRFVREQALRIDHPHVLAPASWAADDDKVLFTMDLVAGGSLVHLVGDYGPLPPALVCTLLDQLLSGLAAVHAEKVVHRDIKPANVLLEATGTARPRLRLSDFGIAMRLGEPRLTETDYVVGTPGYLAPEQMMGADPDFTADLFGVGLVALYLLEGAKPDTRALIEHFMAHGTPGAPRGVPAPLWEVVATLLQPDPAARFRTATGARKALAAAAELLPEPGPDDEQVEIFDQLGPLPKGFGPDGPRTEESGSADVNGSATPRPPTAPGTGSGPARLMSGAIPPRPTTAPSASGTGMSAAASTGFGTSAAEGPRTGPSTPPPPGTGTLSSVAPHNGLTTAAGTSSAATAQPGTSTSAPAASAGTPAPSTAPGTPSSAAQPGSPPSPAVPPEAAHLAAPPRPTVDPTPSQRPPTMSDTGSFHLPPPLPREALRTVPRPPEQPPAPAPVHASRPEPTHVPSGPSAAPVLRRPAYAYAVQSPHAVTRPQEIARRGGKPAVRRPGPQAKIAIPVLLLALVCFAVGFWALTRI
ncbi:protein kinase [Streptomyces sp. NPDC047009]|uniref:serine/threonine-protein kinase n=1 Tax=Streptomyces sp. NPDC047009 TaxID=3154496 RepID=UPI0033DBC98A